MGHITEPKNIDFIIKSSPLSDKERKEISEFIKKQKEKRKAKTSRKRSKDERSRPHNRVEGLEP